MDKPEFHPTTRIAAWLSSDDVKAAVVAVVEARGDDAKSFGWDVLHAINLLRDEAYQTAGIKDNTHG